ncbi:transcriptional regulator, ArsR family [Catenulispora acidiphila DSM 44928]|uniref:Transcriptional regulator, ArsR family n=1 Tax=Catenulispora acidiphila (strain DSM 44928 / JCM 14897 / NBRC 102108 / NRRL B-24433 / ID139908) TaxID=479433 RepID=C7QGJ9_CATAD|nr:helix-turn-helix domain-containing protein [Catenulispora acidiphila]ACU74879.1 transcriptional regulator, ArsR family [Catenulispora acidiphila DSM 44928]
MRIHFTPDDLLHVRFAEEPAPLLELALALASLHRPAADPVFTRWRREAARELPQRARPLLDLIPPCGRGPQFLDPLVPDVEDALERVAASPGSQIRREMARVAGLGRPLTPWTRRIATRDPQAWHELLTAVHTAYDSILTEPWRRLRAGFHAEVAWRTTRWGRLGLGAALESLMPGSKLDGLTWHLAPQKDIDCHLAGHGLTLYPTAMWSGLPLIATSPDGSKLLVYPALTPLPLLPEPQDTDPLGTLLGRTRAQVLEALAEQRTTGKLAHDLGISAASASQHATALREAGLVATRREGKAAWHECTALGAELLRTGVR